MAISKIEIGVCCVKVNASTPNRLGFHRGIDSVCRFVQIPINGLSLASTSQYQYCQDTQEDSQRQSFFVFSFSFSRYFDFPPQSMRKHSLS